MRKYNGGNGSDEFAGEPRRHLPDAFDAAAEMAIKGGVDDRAKLEVARIEVTVSSNPHVSDYLVVLKRRS